MDPAAFIAAFSLALDDDVIMKKLGGIFDNKLKVECDKLRKLIFDMIKTIKLKNWKIRLKF